jgi:hypothetical protein
VSKVPKNISFFALEYFLENFRNFFICLKLLSFISNFICLLFCCSNNRSKRRFCRFWAKSRLPGHPGGFQLRPMKLFFFLSFSCILLKRSNYKDPFLPKEAKGLKRTLVLSCNSAIKAGPLRPVSSFPLGGFVLWVLFHFWIDACLKSGNHIHNSKTSDTLQHSNLYAC